MTHTIFKAGDRVVVRETLADNDSVFANPTEQDNTDMGIRTGEIYTVIRASHYSLTIDARGEELSFDHRWFDPAPEKEPQPPARPTIDFGGDSRATARDYANSLLSKGLKAESMAVLNDAALGYVVDALALNEAVLDAMRQSATRYSQSSQRKDHAKRAAYLGHIVQAVLENHADQLPAYEQGERSRAVESWKGIAISHQQYIDTLTREAAERDELLGEAAQALAEAKAEVDEGTRFREKADAEVTRLLALVAQERERAELAELERDAAAATISYVAERMEDVGRAEMLGYWEGVKDATLPSSEG